MCHLKILKLVLCLSLFVSLKGERSNLCSLVDHHITVDFSDTENRYNNGYKEERYHQVLDAIIEEYKSDISKRGGTFHILRDWGDGAVNAWAWRIGQEYWLEVPGGMARYHLINEEGFLTTICHEIGHLLGGTPHRFQISYEGQADYFSTMKCMERALKVVTKLNSLPSEKDLTVKSDFKCIGHFCSQRIAGINSLTSYYAELEKVDAPTLDTPDLRQVRETLKGHPGSQCRFDTMVAGLRCSSRVNFSYQNPQEGSCEGDGQRPTCWFNREEFLSYN